MKKGLTIGLAGAALAATLTFVAAGSVKREPVTEADALPAYEIVATVRSIGLRPVGQPVRRGPYYVLHANDRHGTEMRVIADAHFGDVLSVAPARAHNAALAPNVPRGPRIIHVPQAGERDERINNRASPSNYDEPAATTDDDDEEEAAPAPRRRVAPPSRATPRWPPRNDATPLPPQRRSDAPPPPPPGPRRAILSAPPPPAEGPTPIRPTPRFGAKAEPADKFAAPRDPAITPGSSPPGYTPPSALPPSE